MEERKKEILRTTQEEQDIKKAITESMKPIGKALEVQSNIWKIIGFYLASKIELPNDLKNQLISIILTQPSVTNSSTSSSGSNENNQSDDFSPPFSENNEPNETTISTDNEHRLEDNDQRNDKFKEILLCQLDSSTAITVLSHFYKTQLVEIAKRCNIKISILKKVSQTKFLKIMEKML